MYLIGLKQVGFVNAAAVLLVASVKVDVGSGALSSKWKVWSLGVVPLVCCFTVKLNLCFGVVISLLKLDNVLLSVVPVTPLYPLGPVNVTATFKPVP